MACHVIFFPPIKDTLPLQNDNPHQKSTVQAIAIDDIGSHADTSDSTSPSTLAPKILHSSPALTGVS